MVSKVIYTVFLVLVSITQHMRSEPIIKGIVVGSDNSPLIGVNITLKGTYDGTITNTAGKFEIETNHPEAILVVSYIGYKTKEVLPPHNRFLTIVLKESVTSLNAVTITAGTFSAGDKKRATVLEPLDIYTTAGSLGDINGALKTLPGTQPAADDGRLLVRGGEASETKVLVDGLLAAKPYYSKVPDLPTRGRFAPSLFSGTVFSTGGYSAEYGQALSSILILESNDIAVEEITSLSLMSIGLEASKTWAAPNRSTSLGLSYTNLAPYFNMTNNRLDWIKPAEAGNVNLMHRQKKANGAMFKCFSTFDFGIQEFNTVVGSNKVNIDSEGGNGYINISYVTPISAASCLKSGLATTINRRRELASSNRTLNTEVYSEARLSIHQPLSEGIDLKYGLADAFTYYQQDYSNTLTDTEYSTNIRDHIAALFIESEIHLSAQLALRPGLRYEYSSYLNQSSLSPRFAVACKTGKNSLLTAAWGHYFQSPQNDYLKYSSSLQFEKATHYLIGYQTGSLAKRLFRVEGYYKNYEQLISYNSFTDYQFQKLANKGNGFAKGIDIFYRDKQTLKRTDFWLSYSYIDTQRHYQDYPKSAMPSFIAEHTFSAVGKYFMGTINTQVGATWTVASGRPYHRNGDATFMNQKAPVYNDLSINLSYLTTLGDHQTIVHFSFSNVLGRNHLVGYRTVSSPDKSGDSYQIPLLPDIKQFLFLGIFISINN
ncbi:TonB-dependent receptor plug domain-containing protein [Carboxylicivirga sediminis]|nr:TonB-dependent receptor [Carboxylicivirga sediminis]